MEETVMEKFIIATCWFGMIMLPIVYFIAVKYIS